MALEMLATGGVDLTLFGVKVDQPFDLHQEIQSIFEPILDELKRLSERPRKIEHLRSDLLYYQQRLTVAEQALNSLKNYQKNAPSTQLKSAFQFLEDRWQRRYDNLKNQVNLVQFELNQALSPKSSSQQDTIEALKKLFGGRLLNLGMALLVMVFVYALLSFITKLYRRYILKNASRKTSFIARIGSLSFYLLTTLVVMLSGMVVLYVRADWVLLGLFLIVLAGAAWAIQKSLPRFLIEAKIILNLGPVKEGQRLVYNQLPWLVKTLHFQATLYNPALTGGTLQVPIKELVNFNSRKYKDTESWFPTETNDWILLGDKYLGQVVQQTPEWVEVKILHAIKTFPVTEFLASNPYNLSRLGFSLHIEFGIDYQHQLEATTTVLGVFQKELHQELQNSILSEHLKSFSVSFSKADTSSLNYVAKLELSGNAAEYYLEIPHILQALIVECCNRNHYVIPFQQLVIHQP